MRVLDEREKWTSHLTGQFKQLSLRERFQSRDHQPYWITETKESICIKIEFNSRRNCLVHHHGRHFFVWPPRRRHVKTLYRHLTNSGDSKGIWTHDLCDASAMLYQLSYMYMYEATLLGAGQFVGLIRSREGLYEWNEMKLMYMWSAGFKRKREVILALIVYE